MVGKFRIKLKRTRGIDFLIRNKPTIAVITLGGVIGILALGVLIHHEVLGAIIGIFAGMMGLAIFRKNGPHYFDEFFSKNRFLAFLVLCGSLFMAFNYIPVSKEVLEIIKTRFLEHTTDSLTLVYAAVILYFVTLIIIFSILYLGIRWGLRVFKQVEKTNNYLIWSIILILFTMIIGLDFIQDTYQSKFPVTIRLEQNEVFSSESYGVCTSYNDFDEFVVGDAILCKFSLVMKDSRRVYNTTHLVYNTEYKVYPGQSFDTQRARQKLSGSDEVYFEYKINLKDEGVSDFVFNFGLINETNFRETPVFDSTERYSFEAITINAYRDRNKDFVTNLVILVSIAVFSILSAAQNLKVIIE